MKLPFPENNDKSKEEKQYAKFLDMMKEVQVTIPILEAVFHVPMYARFFKELLTKKTSLDEPEIVTLTKECSAMILNQMPQSLKIQEVLLFLVLWATENSVHYMI